MWARLQGFGSSAWTFQIDPWLDFTTTPAVTNRISTVQLGGVGWPMARNIVTQHTWSMQLPSVVSDENDDIFLLRAAQRGWLMDSFGTEAGDPCWFYPGMVVGFNQSGGAQSALVATLDFVPMNESDYNIDWVTFPGTTDNTPDDPNAIMPGYILGHWENPTTSSDDGAVDYTSSALVTIPASSGEWMVLFWGDVDTTSVDARFTCARAPSGGTKTALNLDVDAGDEAHKFGYLITSTVTGAQDIFVKIAPQSGTGNLFYNVYAAIIRTKPSA